MQLEDYFNFLAPNDIRIKGTRVGIETVLYDFIHRKRLPEEIAQSYRTITLEQVYATILYYLHNQEAVSKYLADWMDFAHQQRKAQELNPPPALVWLRQELAKRKQTSEEQVVIQK
ncbi:DUF433 domain-containing protein [Floridanema aerugineum]|jgi:uncharacterized protein (DUF433 family)|uniref:DUF433 domain-containing protein n=1 Tax=Floridaenema aerugineum BLCC-F46 TaxID=3153654 RepID=A0ABV4X2Q0_9CYAN